MAEQEIRSVYVTNISPNANEKTVSDFFSFCGKISKLYLKKEEGKEVSTAVIQFETESAAKTALLLTNALIVDRPITVTAYLTSSSAPLTSNNNSTSTTGFTSDNTNSTQEPTPLTATFGTPVENISHKDFGGVHDDERSKTSVIASLLAAGYVLAENALDKAKEIDEKHNFSNRAKVTVDQLKVKAHELDVQYGISEKATAVKNSLTESAQKIDNEFGITAKAVLAANVIKNSAQQGLQKAQENPTIKKGVETVKTTAQQIQTSVTQTFNEVKAQTNKEIETKESQSGMHPPSTVTMDNNSNNNQPIDTTTTDTPSATTTTTTTN